MASSRQVSVAGLRDKFVTVQARTTVAAPGYPTATWSAIGAFWMSREEQIDRNSDERFTGGQESAYQTMIWHLPYRADMDPDLVDVPATRRLLYQGRTYDIQIATRTAATVTVSTLVGSAVTP